MTRVNNSLTPIGSPELAFSNNPTQVSRGHSYGVQANDDIPKQIRPRAGAGVDWTEEMEGWEEYNLDTQPKIQSAEVQKSITRTEQVYDDTFNGTHETLLPLPSSVANDVPEMISADVVPQRPLTEREAVRERLMALKNDPEYAIDDDHFDKYYDQYAEIFARYYEATPETNIDPTTLCKILIKSFKTLQQHEQEVTETGKAIKVEDQHYIVKFADKKLHIIDPKGEILGKGDVNVVSKVNNISLKKFQAMRNPIQVSNNLSEQSEKINLDLATVEDIRNRGVKNIEDKAYFIKVFIPDIGWVIGSIGTKYHSSLGDFIYKASHVEEIDPKTKMSCCLQATKSIVSLENVGVVHRDIKPDNFLINLQEKEGQTFVDVRLSDFDRVRHKDDNYFDKLYWTDGFVSDQDTINVRKAAKAALKAFKKVEKSKINFERTMPNTEENAIALQQWHDAANEYFKARGQYHESLRQQDTYSLAVTLIQILAGDIYGTDISNNKTLIKSIEIWGKMNPGNEDLVEELSNCISEDVDPKDRPTKQEILVLLEEANRRMT